MADLTLDVVLPPDRTCPGTLTVRDREGDPVLGPLPVLGLAEAAAATHHGNPDRLSTHPYGDTPTGAYDVRRGLRLLEATPAEVEAWGPHGALVLDAIDGDAQDAHDHGRVGILIHGGATADEGVRLRATSGSLRMFNADIVALITVVRGAGPDSVVVCDVSNGDDSPPGVEVVDEGGHVGGDPPMVLFTDLTVPLRRPEPDAVPEIVQAALPPQASDTIEAVRRPGPRPPVRQPTVLGPDEPVRHSFEPMYCILSEVLPPDIADELLEHAISLREAFGKAGVLSNRRNYRSAHVVFRPGEATTPFDLRLRQLIPEIANTLKLPPFETPFVERQLTAHNDGDFYSVHADSGSKPVKNRRISFVYHLHRRPRAFTGGQLRLFAPSVHTWNYRDGGPYIDLELKHNEVVAFKSRTVHQVMRVSCPSRDIADSRFTLNGWVRTRPP